MKKHAFPKTTVMANLTGTIKDLHSKQRMTRTYRKHQSDIAKHSYRQAAMVNRQEREQQQKCGANLAGVAVHTMTAGDGEISSPSHHPTVVAGSAYGLLLSAFLEVWPNERAGGDVVSPQNRVRFPALPFLSCYSAPLLQGIRD